jgi:hypothetical protein
MRTFLLHVTLAANGAERPTAIITFPDLESIKVTYIPLSSSRLFVTNHYNTLFVELDLHAAANIDTPACRDFHCNANLD